MANQLVKIVKKAKAMRKSRPNKHKGKKAWQHYMSDASKALKHKPRKHKVGRATAHKHRTKKRKTKKRGSMRVVDRTEVIVLPAVGRRKGTKHRKRSGSPKKSSKRVSGARRVSGNKGLGTALMIGAAVVGLILLTKKAGAANPALPAPSALSLVNTGNPSRDAQAANILAYAQAANLTATAIAAIIQKLNQSSDSDVSSASSQLSSGQMTYDQWQAWYNGD